MGFGLNGIGLNGYWPNWELDQVALDEMALDEMGLDEVAIPPYILRYLSGHVTINLYFIKLVRITHPTHHMMLARLDLRITQEVHN